MEPLKLLNDQALGEKGSPVSYDGLGFDIYSQVIANAATGTPGPFTIGVFGEWGTGKTSMLRMVKDKLDNQEGDDVVTVWFNAWRYEQEEHPIVPLVGTIVHALEKNKGFREKLGDQGSALMRALRAVAYGFSAKAKVKVPGFAEIEAGFVAKDMIEREAVLQPDPLLDRSLYYESFESLEKVNLGGKQRVVVIIDDLDRCFPNKGIKLLESIKLVLGQPGFIFVLGVAREVIEGYLKHRYAKEFGLADFDGKRYLDKIVQLPFAIPDHKNRMVDLSKKPLERLEEPARDSLKEIMPIIASASGGNPRTVIRFINNILIDSNINELLPKKYRIPLAFFAITRILQQRWSECFAILTRNVELCIEVQEWDDEKVKSKLQSEDSDHATIARSIRSYPELLKLLLTKSGKSWLEERKMRDASIQFLNEQRKDDVSQTDTARKPIVAVIYSDEHLAEIRKIGIDVNMQESFRVQYFKLPEGIRIKARDYKSFTDPIRRVDAILVCVGDEPYSDESCANIDILIEVNITKRWSILAFALILPEGNRDNIPSYLTYNTEFDFSRGVTLNGLQKMKCVLQEYIRIAEIAESSAF